MNLVVDASVAAKWFLQDEAGAREAGAREAEEIRKSILSGKVRVFVPELLFVEICNLLIQKSALPSKTIEKFLDALYDLQFTVVPFTKDWNGVWVKICRTYRISSYDGIYVALSQLFSCPLVTADKKLAQKILGAVDVQVI